MMNTKEEIAKQLERQRLEEPSCVCCDDKGWQNMNGIRITCPWCVGLRDTRGIYEEDRLENDI